MKRTEKRPLPEGNMSLTEAYLIVIISLVLGTFMLYQINLYSALLGLCAYISFVFLYTPLKRVTPWAVFVGAFPGAIPPMLGAVAASGKFDVVAGVLIFLQFIWQFPHFWSLAWVLEDDYLKAGFRMLPAADGRSKTSALQILVYTAGLLPIGFLPFLFRMISPVALIITLLAGIYFLRKALKLHKTLEVSDAKALMFASFIYLPVVQLAMMFDSLFVLPYWLNP
jgi:protoheme IX farnesyltransferase